MAQVTNVKTVKTKEQNGVLVEYLVENYGQSADFFVPDGAILDGQIDSRRVRSGMPVEYMSKDGKDFDWGQYSEDVEIQKRIANAFVYIAIALAVAAIVLIITHWDQLKAAMSKLMDWIKGVFSVDWNAQLGVLGEGIEVLLSTVKGIFNSIKQICSGFITFLKGAFTGNIDMALKGVLGILRGVANLVFSIFKTPVNEVIALFNAMGQTIVKAINNLIDGLNHIKVPDWVPGIGGKGINLSHANFRRVPYLAQGAVIPAGNPFLAVLGDQTRGNNLEMPENLLRKIVSEESGKGTGMIKLVVNLDSRTVLERLINTAKEMQMSNGQNVFELGR